jgi:chromosome condensin MukBEF MukE localization factor
MKKLLKFGQLNELPDSDIKSNKLYDELSSLIDKYGLIKIKKYIDNLGSKINQSEYAKDWRRILNDLRKRNEK